MEPGYAIVLDRARDSAFGLLELSGYHDSSGASAQRHKLPDPGSVHELHWDGRFSVDQLLDNRVSRNPSDILQRSEESVLQLPQ